MTPYLQDPDFVLHVGDALETLRSLPAESVHCCVTSPPYFGLRDYGTGTWHGGDAGCDHKPPVSQASLASSTLVGSTDTQAHQQEGYKDSCSKCGARRVDQQLGLEATPDLYVANMVDVFREVRRVLRSDGTLWLNIGDSYARQAGDDSTKDTDNGTLGRTGRTGRSEMFKSGNNVPPAGLKPKDLVGIPWRLAFALQADGWYLRSDIIWSKPNPMPESVTDRPTKAHEYLFLLTKSPRYFYDADAIRESFSPLSTPNAFSGRSTPYGSEIGKAVGLGNGSRGDPEAGRNKRSVWEIATEAYPDAHFATFPQALVEPCVKAGCPEWVCGTCGKPRERQLETTRWRTRNVAKHSTVGEHERSGKAPRGPSDEVPRKGNFAASHETVGFSNCGCGFGDLGDDPSIHTWLEKEQAGRWQPGVVLDPFLGSGTTAQVARRLGRHCIGIELNPAYAELAAKRLAQQSLFACVVDEPAGYAEGVTDHV